jgi:hypothetical protein
MDPGRETRLVPRALARLIAVFVLLAGSVSIINPLFEPSDEIRHYRYVRILVTEHRLPVQDEEAARAQSHHPPLYYALGALLSAWVPSAHDGSFQHPDNPFWGYRNWTIGIDNKLQYWHGPAERFPFREGYLAPMVARWINVLLGAATVALTYHLALRALWSKPESSTKMQREEGPEATARRALLDRGRLARSAPSGPQSAARVVNSATSASAGMRARCPRSTERIGHGRFQCSTSGSLSHSVRGVWERVARFPARRVRALHGYSRSSSTNGPAQLLALAAAAIVALNPQFIYQSAAINNDIVAALSGTALLLACVILLQEGLSVRRLVGLGVIAGVALLSKLQIAAIGPAVALSLALASRRDPAGASRPLSRRLLPWLRALLVVGIVAGAVCGWWYLRNLRLYGDLTGMGKLDEMWVGRDAGDNLWAIRQGLPQLWASLWGRFGYGQIPLPGAMTTGMALICAAGLAGLVRIRRQRITPPILATLGLAILGVTAIVAYYMARQPAGAMGRFLFPVLPAFAVLLVAGIDAWMQSPARTCKIVTAGMGLFAAVALFGYLWPAITYPPRKVFPAGVPADPTAPPVLAQVGDVARILSATVDQDEVIPGDAVFVRVNWEPLRWTEEPLTVFIHLIDEAGVVVAQRDTWPGLSRAPTTSWRAGIPFVDTYRVDLPETIYSPNALTVSIGLYGPAVGRLPIAIGDAATTSAAADSLTVGTLTVPRQDGAWANPIDINFGDDIHLVGYEIWPRALAPGGTATLTLTWELPVPPAVDPYIFAQIIDAEWNVWGSSDGGHPEWSTGIVTDTRRITLIPETPPGSYPVNVGLVSEGKRLRIIADNGSLLGDFVSLGPIGVR